MITKKALLTAGVTLAAALVLSTSQVLAVSTVTTVRGNVYNLNQPLGGGHFKGIGGLTVHVVCVTPNKPVVSANDITDSFGLYTNTFPFDNCEKFIGKVTSTVTYNAQTQSESAYVSNVHTVTNDFYFGSTDVPEFSMITGAVALLGTAAAFFLLRKKSII